jgi:SAM-dependent methyltransferase
MDLRERPRQDAARHPWEIARFDFFLRVLADAQALSARRVLDVGSGDAWFARKLSAHLPPDAQVTCWDSGYAGLDAAPAGSMTLCADRPTSAFDLVTALDVLEHVKDDRAFLQQIVEENLSPGAHLLISVPAWPSLYTTHDAALLHHRRYRPSDGLGLVRGVGLHVLRSGGLFTGLLVPRALRRLAEFLTRPAPPAVAPPLQWTHGPRLARLVHSVLSLDGAASLWASSRGRSLPGLSWWALCRKS